MWIDFLCHDMMADTINKVVSSSNKNLVKSWYPIWIPYYNGINSAPSISFPSTKIRAKYPRLKAKGLSWNNGRALLYRSNFSKWDNYGTLSDRNLIVKACFIFNRMVEDVNTFRSPFQENLMDFHAKVQVWKSKLQFYPEPYKVGHVMYFANNIQTDYFI